MTEPVGADALVHFGPGITIVTEGTTGDAGGATDAASTASVGDDTAFVSEVTNAARERGIDLAQAQAEGVRLFAGEGGSAALDVIEDQTLAGLSPEAEVQAHAQFANWLADLARLRADAPQDAAEGMDPAAFDTALSRALQQQGISRQMLAEIESDFFADAPEALAHVRRYLDSVPSGARIAAYVRTAEALLMLRGLHQGRW